MEEIPATNDSILFVDDEENILRSLKRLFIEDDYTVMTANSGSEALKILSKHSVSLIVSDQRMPEMTGSQFLAKAREIQPDAMRIMLTGYSDIKAAVDAINAGGIYRYVTKPWNDDDIKLLIKEAVERYRLVRENKRLTELTQKQNEELKQWNETLEHRVAEQTHDIEQQNKELKKLNERLRANFRYCLESFSNLIELREPSVSNHSRNVAMLSIRTAKKMGIQKKELEAIGAAALLHDIGKIGIPDRVIQKPEEELTREERRQIQQHPVRGQTVVEHIPDLREAGILIRHHHELWNGTGYPDRLVRDTIPLGARIIAIADAIDRNANRAQKARQQDFMQAVKIINRKHKDIYDKDILTVTEEVVQDLINSSVGSFASEVQIKDLDIIHPGMILSQEVRSGTGILILAANSILTEENMRSLKRHLALDPNDKGIYIWEDSAKNMESKN